jgi:hypothetical protein
MIVRMLAYCTLVAVLAANVAAEEASPPANESDKKIAELETKIAELETKLAEAGKKTADLETAATDLTSVAESQKARIDQLEQRQTTTEDTLTETLEKLSVLKEEVIQKTTVLNAQGEAQRKILDAISKMDSAGNPIPILSANMSKSEEFSKDVRDAVHNSLEKQGAFTITNKTSSYRRVWVNRVEHGVAPGETLTLTTPIGTVATQLPGKELKTWTLSAPDYEEHIEIIPEQRTVYYPSAPAYTDPAPVYMSSPVYFEPAPFVYYDYYVPYF